MIKGRCQTCKAWVELQAPQDGPPIIGGPKVMICIRRSPTPVIVPQQDKTGNIVGATIQSIHPSTSPDHECYDHLPRKKR